MYINSVSYTHLKLYIIMEDYTNLYVVQYNEEKYKVLIKGYMRQICFGGECLYYIDKGGAGIYEINLNTQKQQRIRGIKWYEDYEMEDVYKRQTRDRTFICLLCE